MISTVLDEFRAALVADASLEPAELYDRVVPRVAADVGRPLAPDG